jgi:hypothetical protein
MEELDKAPDRAVTCDGIYKQKPTRRKLTQRLALGSEIHTWIETGKTWDLGNTRLPDRSGKLYRLKDLQDELSGLSSRIEFLETPERAARIKKREEMQDQERVANIAIGQLTTVSADALGGFEEKLKVLAGLFERQGFNGWFGHGEIVG